MNIALRNVPEDLHAELKAAAKRNHRSLNGEILARLALFRRPSVLGPAQESGRALSEEQVALLERVRERQTTIRRIDLSPETIKALKEEGRP